jgi:Uma2 family endonuclease
MYQTSGLDLSKLPTMYDLPSEEVGEPGLPDEFHRIQADLMEKTFQSETIAPDRCLIASDLNLYYDPANTRFYKRPDWFLALNVSKGQYQQDLRLSYVTWHEPPLYLIVEFLSPSTEAEDLGRVKRDPGKPPGKWDVYERFLQIPYYALYDRYTNTFRLFHFQSDRYHEVKLFNARFWFPELELGLGVWQGVFEGFSGRWLRWYDRNDRWIPTPQELAKQEAQRAEQEAQRAEQEAQRAEQEAQRAEQEAQRADRESQARYNAISQLLALGLSVEQVAASLGFSVEEVKQRT